MGSLDNSDGSNDSSKKNPNLENFDTEMQDFDSQCSSPSLSGVNVEAGNGDGIRFDDDDTIPVDDEFETQLLNFGGETQLLDIGDETQVFDSGDETQVLDYLGEDTQLLDDFDNVVVNDSEDEGSDRTQVLEDDDDDDDITAGDLEMDNIQCASAKSLSDEADGLNGKPCNSGRHVSTSTPVAQGISESGTGPRFTSIRAASLRASGLAARNMSLKGISSESCSVLNYGRLSDQHTVGNNGLKPKVVDEVDPAHGLGTDNDEEKGLRNGSKCRTGSSTVRKLFTDDSLSNENELHYNSDHSDEGDDVAQFPVCDGELAGLSYVNSQEPGELSQANALKFVDMLIEKTNFDEFDLEVDHGKSAGGKSKPVSTAKGPQSLAKKVNDRSTVREAAIFDWDDTREDEGGGDIFCRRKDEFFGTGSDVKRSLTEPQKSKKRNLGVNMNMEEQLDVHDKIMVQSDSRAVLHRKRNKKKAPEAEIKFKKNLVDELDEQFNIDSSRGQLEANGTETDVAEMLNVGPDTQMAAEAMEALFCGEGITDLDVGGLPNSSNGSAKGSLRGKSKNRVGSKQPYSQKRACLPEVGVATRQSKKTKRTDTKLSKDSPVSSVKNSKNIRKDCDTGLVITKTKRAKSTAEEHFINNGIKNMDDLPSKITGERMAKGALKSNQRKEFNKRLGTATSSGGHSSKKQNFSEAIKTFTPVATRTRHSMLVNQLRRDEHVPDDCREKFSPHMDVGTVEENITGSKNVEASEVLHAKRKSSRLGSNQSGELENAKPEEFNKCLETATSSGGHSIKKQNLLEAIKTSIPVASRTRHSKLVSQLRRDEHVPDDCCKKSNHLTEVGALEENRTGSKDVEASEVLHAKRKSSRLGSNQSGELENAKPSKPEELHSKLTAMSYGIDALRYPRKTRSIRNLYGRINRSDKLDAQSRPSVQPEDTEQSITGHKRSRSNASASVNLTIMKKIRSSVRAVANLSPGDRTFEGKMSEKSSNKRAQRNDAPCGPSDMNEKMTSADFMGAKAVKHSDRKSVADPSPSAENEEMRGRLDKSPREKCKASSDSACTSPVNCMTPVNAASPVCMGNEYFKQSCRKNLSKSCLRKEISMLIDTESSPISPSKELRKRRDITGVRVLFSHHLDDDIIKQQKKILARVGASVADSITDATHFVTDEFVRTRNMLEAIASGKPVVTPLWLESIGQVKVHMDEEAYLLRDTKKEKEFGFSMPVTLARARQHPLLQDRRVFITPNTKPGKEILSNLVKAVHGQAVERMGRSALKDDKVLEDLLIISCEEDYGICEPFLEKGTVVCSSELLLNGIVTQKLEYERHRLFADHVKRTRSTIWLKKDGQKFHPVTKLK